MAAPRRASVLSVTRRASLAPPAPVVIEDWAESEAAESGGHGLSSASLALSLSPGSDGGGGGGGGGGSGGGGGGGTMAASGDDFRV